VNVASKTNEQSTWGSGGQEVKVAGGRTYVRKPGGDIILYPLNRVETKRHAISDGNVAHRFNCTPPPAFVNMRLADALVRGQISRQQ